MIVVTGGLGSITGSILAGTASRSCSSGCVSWKIPSPSEHGSMAGIPGMRMVVFSLMLILIILFRREGIMGMREITWDGVARFMKRGKA
jgi:branched-chain amino acid transport system permease protein